MGFLPLQIHLKELTVAYAKKTQKGPAKKHIKKECNAIQDTIAHWFQPKTKLPMQPTKKNKLKKMAAAITKTDIQQADLSKAQHRKNKRVKIQKAFKKQ